MDFTQKELTLIHTALWDRIHTLDDRTNALIKSGFSWNEVWGRRRHLYDEVWDLMARFNKVVPVED